MSTQFNDYFEYTIAGEYLPALINGDYSGLEDHEIKLFDSWYASTQENTPSGLFEVVGEESNFDTCEVCGLFSDTVTVRQYFHNAEVTA